MQIQCISASQTYDLRQQVLRPGLPTSCCKLDGDNGAFTRHFGAFVDKCLVSIVSLYLKDEHSSVLQADSGVDVSYQLRALATDPEFRNKGYAAKLIAYAERFIMESLSDLSLKSDSSVSPSQIDYADNSTHLHHDESDKYIRVLIWCNARSSATGFYQKLGYQIVGEEFEIPDVGLHFRMRKIIKSGE